MKEQRVPCPHCGELIMPQAKKCRFCHEELVEKKPTSLRSLYWTWFLSMAIFIIAVFFVRRAPTTSATTWLAVLGTIVLCGVIAFLALVTRLLRSLSIRNTRWYGLAALITFFAFFALLFNYDKVEAKLGFTLPRKDQPEIALPINRPLPTIIATPTSKPSQQNSNTTRVNRPNQVDCTGPDGKTFQTTQAECDNFNRAWGNTPTPNPNDIVRCNISPNCGGGYKEMRKADCDQMVCCEVDFNNTTKLTSKDQCAKEQQQNSAKAWSDTCNNMCSAYDSNTCANYWAVGTQGRSDCIADANRQKTSCLSSCYSRQP